MDNDIKNIKAPHNLQSHLLVISNNSDSMSDATSPPPTILEMINAQMKILSHLT